LSTEREQIIIETFNSFSSICNEVVEELEDDLSSISKKIHILLDSKLQDKGILINEQIKAFTVSAIMMSIFDFS
jgi:hypothetical protein